MLTRFVDTGHKMRYEGYRLVSCTSGGRTIIFRSPRGCTCTPCCLLRRSLYTDLDRDAINGQWKPYTFYTYPWEKVCALFGALCLRCPVLQVLRWPAYGSFAQRLYRVGRAVLRVSFPCALSNTCETDMGFCLQKKNKAFFRGSGYCNMWHRNKVVKCPRW
mgnify:CR=1 FL=1